MLPLLLILLFFSITAYAEENKPQLTLEMLEKVVVDSPAVQAEAYYLDARMSLLRKEEAREGLEFFAGINYGTVEEPVTEDLSRQYERGSMRMGVLYPLLGSRAKQRSKILDASYAVSESRYRKELVIQETLAALRRYYILYWGNDRKQALIEAYLENEEDVSALLQKRSDKRLLFESDRLELMSSFVAAQHDLTKLALKQDRNLGFISILADRTMTAFAPVLESLQGRGCFDQATLTQVVMDDHPELNLLRQSVEKQLQQLQTAASKEINADLRLDGAVTRDFPGDQGHAVTLSFNIRMPVGVLDAQKAERDRLRAELKMAQLALELRSRELSVEVRTRLHHYQQAQAQLTFMQSQWTAANEAVREAKLRAQRLDSATLEQLYQRQYRLYRRALAQVDAEAELRLAEVALLELAELKNCEQQALGRQVQWNPTPGVAVLDQAPKDYSQGFGFYVWDSRALMNELRDDEAWVRLKADGVTRLLFSLDGDQIRKMTLPASRDQIKTFIEQAREQGIDVELLLGEPTWILPGVRQELLAIIQQLQDLPFSGLHLDLEPEQLEFDYEEVATEFLHTLRAARDVSPWPLSISVHPRFFSRDDEKVCFSCAIETLRLSEVVLMIYVANSKNTQRIADKVMDAHPQIRFSVAQSVERILSPEESLAHRGKKRALTTLVSLRSRITKANFNGVIVQSWGEFQAIKP